jgi:hypothetical protein
MAAVIDALGHPNPTLAVNVEVGGVFQQDEVAHTVTSRPGSVWSMFTGTSPEASGVVVEVAMTKRARVAPRSQQ